MFLTQLLPNVEISIKNLSNQNLVYLDLISVDELIQIDSGRGSDGGGGGGIASEAI